MFGLLLTALVTSAVDSINPIGITQQFVLQGMVKKPKHIWYFILPTGLTNLAGGFLAYYGLVGVIGEFLTGVMASYGHIIFRLELILGMLFLVGAGYIVQNGQITALKKELKQQKDDDADEAALARKIKSVSPLSLVFLGIAATISELTSALPYFAFLAVLLTHQIPLWQVTVILVIYNFIYMLPLMILYFVYVKARSRFDRLYAVIKAKMSQWAGILAPLFVGLVGALLVYHALAGLII